MIRRRVVVHGLVQGVLFRDSCRREAGRRGVVGWVRNTGAGDVEAELEGLADAVEQMITWCRRGPSRAHVERVDVIDLDPLGEHSFEVR